MLTVDLPTSREILGACIFSLHGFPCAQPAYSNLLLWLCTNNMKHGLNKEIIITYYVDILGLPETIWIYVTRSNWSAEQRGKKAWQVLRDILVLIPLTYLIILS